MSQALNPLRFTGATVLRDGELQRRSLAVADGRITKGPLPEIDLSGYLILPGIIDLHGDAFERHVAPRPSAPFALATGLAATDRDAAANGVTTAWLAQSWSWEGGRRGPDYAEKMMAAVRRYMQHGLTDMRVQIRCETHMVDSAARLLEAIDTFGISYVVFNNHLNEAVDHARDNPDVIFHWARQAGRSPKEHMALVNGALERGKNVPRHLCRLADAFDNLGVTYGSHDDPDGETREHYSMIGARIAEFPTSRKAAAAAKAMNDPVLMGAPNVVRGGSQSGNIAAIELIRQGLCDVLVSDYYYPALAEAAWRLVDDRVMDLPEAWAMISEKPADILRLTDRGKLEYGKRADFVVINQQTRAIEMTVTHGRLSHLCGEAARRFVGGQSGLKVAAE